MGDVLSLLGQPYQDSLQQPREQNKDYVSNLLDNANLPMLKLATSLLQAGNESPFTAIGQGIDAYTDTRAGMAKSAADAKQQEFENIISSLNAESTRMNSEVATQNSQFENLLKADLHSLDKMEKVMKIKEMEQKIQQDPYMKQALDFVKNDAQFPYLTPEEQMTTLRRISDTLRNTDIQGSSENTRIKPPEGFVVD
jgi:hypothetical protein